MKFIADTMLGRLAKWMRVAGCDVLYYHHISDEELIERAHKEKRTILTRDTLLIKRKKVRENALFIKDDDFRVQFLQVLKHFHIHVKNDILIRCIRCNEKLLTIEKEKIKNQIPLYVFNTQEQFGICPLCKKVYWSATHKDKMMKELDRILRKNHFYSL